MRCIGSSSYSGLPVFKAQRVTREYHLKRFVTEQPPYSILVRGIEGDVLPTARCHGMETPPRAEVRYAVSRAVRRLRAFQQDVCQCRRSSAPSLAGQATTRGMSGEIIWWQPGQR